MNDTPTRTAAEILRAAKERIADQGHFVMGTPAWNRRGRQVEATSPDACRWNARGALLAVNDGNNVDRLYRYVDQAAWSIAKTQGLHFPAGTDVADNMGHALTLQALEDAALLAEAEAVAS